MDLIEWLFPVWGRPDIPWTVWLIVASIVIIYIIRPLRNRKGH